MISAVAEAGAVHPVSILDNSFFFLPLPVNKPPDFSGAIIRDCYEVISIGAEAGADHPASMLEPSFITCFDIYPTLAAQGF